MLLLLMLLFFRNVNGITFIGSVKEKTVARNLYAQARERGKAAGIVRHSSAFGYDHTHTHPPTHTHTHTHIHTHTHTLLTHIHINGHTHKHTGHTAGPVSRS